MHYHYNTIDSLTISQRTSMKNQLILKMSSFFLFILLPVALIQELFILPHMIETNIIDISLLPTIWNYFIEHYILQTYLLLIIFAFIGLAILLHPYINYIMTGENKEKVIKKTLNPTYFFIFFLSIPNICNLINLAMDYEYIFSIPTASLINFVIVKIVWQILCAILTIFFFFSVNHSMRDTLNLYSFDLKSRSFFAISKEITILLLQLTIFIIIFLEVFIQIDTRVTTMLQHSFVNFIYYWGIIFFILCNAFTNSLLVYQQRVNYRIKKYIYHDVQNLVTTGNLNTQSTYYEQNTLGAFVSEYNKFIGGLKNNFLDITQSTLTLNQENKALLHHTSDLISQLEIQEENVTRMNIATNQTSATIQYLLQEVNTKYKTLVKEQETIEQLTHGSTTVIDTFNDIIQEHELGKESAQKALEAVQNSLHKGQILNDQIFNIHGKIQQAGQETAAIDEVLNIIRNIAEQTNLLSMSAAIEAAHGDTSRTGFTLVAEEIRQLAQMSQDSVGKIVSRLSIIQEHISQAHSISTQSINLANSSVKTYALLEKSIEQVINASIGLTDVTKQAEPITLEQSKLITEFQQTMINLRIFLQKLITELQHEGSTSVLMAINFRNMIRNFTKERAAIYYIETSLEKLAAIEKRLNKTLLVFSSNDNDSPLNK